ncbi:MAG TPA: hypothetical protein DHV68_04900 [Dehalococcoidia bacterium]|nr:hypothetical protein [Chloroflexota bacterium]HCI86162.1 hypothetical protein [Dehalococcoidia bacterium]
MDEVPLVNRTIRRIVGKVANVLVPEYSETLKSDRGDTSRQLSFDFARKSIGKPTAEGVDELIRSTLELHEAGLSLPSVRVSSRMRRTLGSYMPSKKQIAISSRLLAIGDENDLREVVLHEVAHAIVHARWGEKPSAHGKEFRSVCKEIGARPRRYVDVTTSDWTSQVRYLSKCVHCKVLIVRKRRMRSVRCACGLKCTPSSWRAVAPAETGVPGEWVML